MALLPVFQSISAYTGEQFVTVHFQVGSDNSSYLDATNPPAFNAFIHGTPLQHSVVLINGTEYSITAIEVNGTDNTVKIAFTGIAPPGAYTLLVGDLITIEYIDPTPGNDDDAIQEILYGNDAQSFTELHTVPGPRPAADTTAPLFLSAATNSAGTKIIMTYDEALDATHAAGVNDFQVTVAGIARTVSSVTVSGSTVELTLASAITNGQAVTVAYNDLTPGNDPDIVQDAAGNDSASIVPAVEVTNSVPAPADTTPPAFVSAATSTDGTKVILTYDEALSATTAEVGAFTVKVGGVDRTVTGVSVNGLTVELTLATAVTSGQSVTVAYTASNEPAVNAVQDAAGNDAESISPAATVTNSVPDTTAPTMLSAEVSADGLSIVITYSEPVAGTLEAGDYGVTLSTGTASITGATVGTGENTHKVTLTLAAAIVPGLTVTNLVYTKTAGTTSSVVDTASPANAAETQTLATVTNSSTVDNIAPTVTHTSAAYDEGSNMLTITGTDFATLLDSGEDATTDIKERLDWSKLTWDINGDDGTTANVSFAVDDIVAVKVTNGTTLTIILTPAKRASLESTAGYDFTGNADTLDIAAGFAKDAAGNAATTDALANGVMTIAPVMDLNGTNDVGRNFSITNPTTPVALGDTDAFVSSTAFSQMDGIYLRILASEIKAGDKLIFDVTGSPDLELALDGPSSPDMDMVDLTGLNIQYVYLAPADAGVYPAFTGYGAIFFDSPDDYVAMSALINSKMTFSSGGEMGTRAFEFGRSDGSSSFVKLATSTVIPPPPASSSQARLWPSIQPWQPPPSPPAQQASPASASAPATASPAR